MSSVKIIAVCLSLGCMFLVIGSYLYGVQHISQLPLVDGQYQMLPASQRALTGHYEVEDLRRTNWTGFPLLRKRFIGNAHLGNSGGITSDLKSSYQLVDKVQRDDGTIIHIRLIARDDTGSPRQGGGDFWTATLSSVGSGHFSTAGHIVDHYNGTYSVYFFAVWQGMSDVNITLIHPSAAVEYLRAHVWTKFRAYYGGHFKRGDVEATTLCTIVSTSERWENKCVFHYPLALGNHVFVCDPPGKNLSCDSLISYGNEKGGPASTRQLEELKGLMKGSAYLFLNRTQRRLQNGPGKIYTQRGGAKISTSTAKTKPDFSSGYWEGTTWRSLQINHQDQFNDKHRIGECLRNKQIYFNGESTLCQIVKLFKIEFGVSGPPTAGKQTPEFIQLEDYNITLRKTFHHMRAGATQDFDSGVFEVDILESLGNNDSCDYVIVFGFGMHYRQWSRSAFVDRVTQIKSAVLRFRKRCPHSPIIIKGPHKSTDLETAVNQQLGINVSDWIVYEILSIMKLHFQNAGVLFLDVWDMNLSFPVPDELHMPDIVVKQELYMVLSMICL